MAILKLDMLSVFADGCKYSVSPGPVSAQQGTFSLPITSGRRKYECKLGLYTID